MNLEEFKERRAQLERDIFKANSKLLSDFQTETGLQVSEVSIHLESIDPIGVPSTSVISEVEIHIGI